MQASMQLALADTALQKRACARLGCGRLSGLEPALLAWACDADTWQ